MYFCIDYFTGTVDYAEGTLEDAKKVADEGAVYSGEPISICDVETGAEITRREWNKFAYKESFDMENPITFGGFGFYSDWL